MSEEWTFTDDVPVTVTLDSTPLRIVAEADSARALFDLGITPVGIFGSAPLDQLPQLEGMPLDEIESLGEAWGVVNIEAIAAVEPDLVVSTHWADGSVVWGFEDEVQQGLVEEIAPVIGIDISTVATHGLIRFEELAISLGADPDVTAEARQGFEVASEGLRVALEAKPGLQILAVSAWPEALYIAEPEAFGDLAFFIDEGANLIVPSESDGFWQTLSWEGAATYEADLIIIDARVFSDGGTAGFEDQPTWQALAPVEAGQTGKWYAGAAPSYEVYTDVVEQLTALIEQAEDITP
jgi:iron complex transport system substrate-binding protein